MRSKLLALAAAPLLGASASHAALLVHYDFNNGDATNNGTLGDGTVEGGSFFSPGGAGFSSGGSWYGNRVGANDAYIQTGLTGNDLGMGADGVYTAMAWMRWNGGVDGTSVDHMVFGQDDGDGNNSQLHHGIRDDSDSNIHFGGWGGDQDIADAGVVGEGTWTHVTWQYDGTNQNVFLDGVLSATEPGNNITDPSLNVIIGAHGRDSNNGAAPGNSFNGHIDEVRIYDEVLTAEQILDVRNSAIPEPSTVGLLGLAAFGLFRRRR